MLVLGRLELHPDVWAELAEDHEALLLAVVPYVPLRCLGALRVHLHILRAIIQASDRIGGGRRQRRSLKII